MDMNNGMAFNIPRKITKKISTRQIASATHVGFNRPAYRIA